MTVTEHDRMPERVPASYFLPESREGFYVSDMMKRYWAAQLKVLAEIEKICERHDIPFFADCGSLIGAVRHGGYIPWDDDFDIAMLRHDLRRFLKVAEQELPKGYVILDLHHEEEYTMYLTRITNARSIDYSPEHLSEFYGCPFTVGVDIFPLDGLYEDEEQEEERRLKARDAILAARLVAEGKAETPECKKILARLEQNCHRSFTTGKALIRQLLLLAEKLFSECDSETATHLAMMPFWAEYHDHRYDSAWYRHAVRMPFEYTTLPVPAQYNAVLKTVYGDFMRIVKAGGLHDYPVYRAQEEIFREKTGRYPWRYTYDPKDEAQVPRPLSREESIRRMTQMLREAQSKIETLLRAGQEDAAAQLAASCKNLADALEQRMTRKKKAVFLAVKACWWPMAEPYYRAACAEEECEVTVIALPFLEASPDGSSPVPKEEGTLFPPDIPLTKASAYDFGAEEPDVIYLQSPYDGECNAVMLPEFFHTKNLKRFTPKLVCLPCHDLYTPEAQDGKAQAALQVLAEQPGIIFSDEVRVPTEGLREVFAGALRDITGEGGGASHKERIFAFPPGIAEPVVSVV